VENTKFVHIFSRPIQRALRRNALTGTLYAIASLRFGANCYLRDRGWWESFRARGAVDGNWLPIPWYTYPAIDFLSSRVKSDWKVFEYGSGHSTLWWARHVAQVTSCEYDSTWFDIVETRRPGNVSLLHRNTGGGGYARVLEDYPARFDVVVIDGMERVECARYAAPALNAGGIVIWDNSDKNKYTSGMDLLQSQGFKRLDFDGPGPGAVRGWSTSVFYRTGNCLGL